MALTFTVFDAPGAGVAANNGTWVWAVNASGASTGYADPDFGNEFGWLRDPDGTMHLISYPASYSTTPKDINDSGIVMGEYSSSDRHIHGFIRAVDGTLTNFDVPGVWAAAFMGTRPAAINSNGDIVGVYADTVSTIACFIRFADGSFITFALPASGTGLGRPGPCINDIGVTAGCVYDGSLYHGWVRAVSGTVTVFDSTTAGTSFGQGTRVNANGLASDGTIVGDFVNSANANKGYKRAPDGTITEFDVYTNTTVNSEIANSAASLAGTMMDNSDVLHGFIATGVTTNIGGSYQIAGSIYRGWLRASDGSLTAFDCPGAGTTEGHGQGTIVIDLSSYAPLPPPSTPTLRCPTPSPPPSFEITRDLDADWDDSSTFIITQDEPLPFTLRGLVMRMSYNPD